MKINTLKINSNLLNLPKTNMPILPASTMLDEFLKTAGTVKMSTKIVNKNQDTKSGMVNSINVCLTYFMWSLWLILIFFHMNSVQIRMNDIVPLKAHPLQRAQQQGTQDQTPNIEITSGGEKIAANNARPT